MTVVRVACLIVPIGLLIAAAAVDDPGSNPAVKLPAPPERIAKSAEQAKECIECHEEIADLLEGDKHIADDFHCTVCHGVSEAHIEMEEMGTLPDRAWRRWIKEENGFEWRVKHASLEIAKFCASCHGQKPPEKKPPEKKRPKKPPAIDWKEYLDTEHGRAVVKDNHDAPTCTDCHYAHGAGAEPMTDKTIVRRCALCHADKKMMKRADLDPGVIDDFKAGTHANMDEASAEEKSSCVKCHPPH